MMMPEGPRVDCRVLVVDDNVDAAESLGMLLEMEGPDEEAFFRFLSQYNFEVYPRRVPPDWKPFRANEEAVGKLPDDEGEEKGSE